MSQTQWLDDPRVRPGYRAARSIAKEITDIPDEYQLVNEATDAHGPVAHEPANPIAPQADEKIDPKPLVSRILDRMVAAHDARKAKAEAEDNSTFGKVKRAVLRAVAISSALACAVVSGYFLYKYFSDTQPGIIASIMSVTVAATITTAPEFAVSLARKRKYLSAAVVLAVAVLAMGYSMSSTIARVYNAKTEKLEAVHEASGESQAVLQAAARDSSMLQARLSRYNDDLSAKKRDATDYAAQIQKRLDEGESPTSAAMVALVANRNKAQAEITRIEKDIKATEDALMASSQATVLAESTVDRADFVSWLAGVLGIARDTIELALASFPAIFNDIAAPVMLIIAFAL